MVEIVSKIQTVSDFLARFLVELKIHRGGRVGVAGASLASVHQGYVDVFTFIAAGLI